ncbi:MAG TPA: hypothetical protein VGN57_06715 [Pirellulaceae bacterium]|jgi:hypothetical protein|nr:hypothetical protein [Pirellulaceae bacterium]
MMQPCPVPVLALVIGNSHMKALRHAYQTREVKGRREGLELQFIQVNLPEFRPVVIEGRFQPGIEASIQSDRLQFIVSTFGGNDHNVLGLVNHPQQFDFVLPEEPDLPLQADAEILPHELLRRTLRARLAPTRELMAMLREATELPVLHLESPPTIPSEEHILHNRFGFPELIEEYGVAPAELRYKLWRLHSSLVQEICDELRFKFVPAPKAMQDERNMLVEEAWWYDPTHANEVYGERLVRQLLAIVERRFLANQQVS